MCKMPPTRDISQHSNITLLTAVLAFQRSLRKELCLILLHAGMKRGA